MTKARFAENPAQRHEVDVNIPRNSVIGHDGDKWNFINVGDDGVQTVKQNILNEALILYESGTTLYVCKAAIGSALSSAVWQIKKVDTSSGVVIQWCDSNSNYDNSCESLAVVQGYTYA